MIQSDKEKESISIRKEEIKQSCRTHGCSLDNLKKINYKNPETIRKLIRHENKSLIY